MFAKLLNLDPLMNKPVQLLPKIKLIIVLALQFWFLWYLICFYIDNMETNLVRLSQSNPN